VLGPGGDGGDELAHRGDIEGMPQSPVGSPTVGTETPADNVYAQEGHVEGERLASRPAPGSRRPRRCSTRSASGRARHAWISAAGPWGSSVRSRAGSARLDASSGWIRT